MRTRPPRLRLSRPQLQPTHSIRDPSSRLAPRPLHTLSTPRLQNASRTTCISHQQTRSIRSVTQASSRYPHIPKNRPEEAHLPILEASPLAAYHRKLAHDTLPLRTGAVATKVGMTGIYDPTTAARMPATVLQLDRVQVVAHKTLDKHGYYAVVMGGGHRNAKNVGPAMMGVFDRALHTDPETGEEVGLNPKAEVIEFRVRDENGLLAIGSRVTPTWFLQGQFVDCRSKTKGKGFAGVMKRHGMKGQPRSHGHSLSHRSIGSVGGSQGSGSRVHPGKRMAGNMGNEMHTVKNLQVLRVDEANGIVVVKGCVPGANGSWVKIQDAKFKAWPDVPSMPAAAATVVEPMREAAGPVQRKEGVGVRA